MKQAFPSNWTFFRVLRLFIGVIMITQAIMTKEPLFGIAGLMITSMAILNVGCCGAGSCRIPIKKTSQPTKDIPFEEVG